MTEERITTRDDGVVQERTVERSAPGTVVVERRSGAGVVIGILAVLILAAIAYFLFVGNEREGARDGAITDAAEAVEGAATEVGDAAKRATDSE